MEKAPRGLRGRSKVLYRYILSYLCVGLLPLLVISAIFYGVFFKAYESEVLGSAEAQISQARLSVDAHLGQLHEIANHVFLNRKLKPFYFSRDNMAGRTARTELSAFAAINSFASEFVFYPGVDDYLFSSRSSYAIDNYLSIYHYSAWTKEEFENAIRTPQQAWVRPADDVKVTGTADAARERNVVFLFPDIIYQGPRQRKLLAIVPEARFQALLAANTPAKGSTMLLIDPAGQLIVSTNRAFDGKDLPAILQSAAGHAGQAQLSGGKTLLLGQTSAETGWQYITLIETRVALEKVYAIRSFMFLVLGGVFLLGLGLVIVAATGVYRPVRELASATANMMGQPEGANEFDYIRQSMIQLHDRNLALTDEMGHNTDAIREYLLFNLLKGQLPSLAYFNEKGARVGLAFRHELFAVVVLHAVRQEDIKTCAARAAGMLRPQVEAYARKYNEDHHLTLICNLAFDQQERFGQIITRFRARLAEELSSPLTVGCSRLYTGMEKLPAAYMEAKAALDYRFLHGQNTTIFAEDCPFEKTQIDYSLRHISQKLSALIEKGDQESIEHLLQNVGSYMKEQGPSLFVCRMICFDIINTVMRSVDEIHQAHMLTKSEYPNVFMISSFETMDELLNTIKAVSADLLRIIHQRKAAAGATEPDSMLAYIGERYADCTFSVQQMADDFHVSPSAISQRFKESHGMTVMEYATALRMRKAKTLVSGSKMPMQDIALEVGYYNAASFIRRFKQIVGMTPGEYRLREKGGEGPP